MLNFELFCVLALSKSVLCSVGWPFTDDFQTWIWQSSVVAGSWLYIDGGESYFKESSAPVNGTLSIDLSQSWTIGDVVPTFTTKPSTMTLARRPLMWYDSGLNTVYSGGGWWYTDTSDSYTLWSFTPDAQGGVTWHEEPSYNDLFAQNYIPTIGSAFTASDAAFYSLGGAYSNVNDEAPDLNLAVQGLVMQDATTGVWSNSSSAGAFHNGRSVFAEAVFMPNFGKDGLLAFLGGDSPANSTYKYEAGIALVDMSNITIYDPVTDTWYHQTATGAIPPPRSEFCAVGNAPTDNESFEIYVYGGSTTLDKDLLHASDTGYTDVYVLSLPSFTWFRTNAPTSFRRANHFCQVIENSQMLVIGGRNPSEAGDIGTTFDGEGDPWIRGMKIFDMATWRWTNTYNHTAIYTRPQVIQQHYSTATNDTNWSTPALASLFHVDSASPSAKPAPSHTGAIIGGAIGGVAFFAIILGVVFFWCVLRPRHSRSVTDAAKRDHDTRKDWKSIHEMPQPPVREPVYEMLHPSVREVNGTPAELG